MNVHDSPLDNRTGVLIVNLGTPTAASAQAVRDYLREFLADPRVVRLPRFLWLPLLHNVIAPLRSKSVAHKYAEVWMDDGSPLHVYTRRIAEQINKALPGGRVRYAMRYVGPRIDTVLAEMKRDGCEKVIVLPLYPQYSTTTTASVEDVLARCAENPSYPQTRLLNNYANDQGVIQALANSVRRHWQQHGKAERLLLSYHGIPQAIVDQGDPYRDHCQMTTEALRQALELDEQTCVMTFQSRFGGGKWLQPATNETVTALAQQGVKSIDIMCPGFPADCLETLEEIAMQNAGFFKEAGGETFRYIASLNDHSEHIDALRQLVENELKQWN